MSRIKSFNPKKAYEKYAAEIGKRPEDLDREERQVAIFNYFLSGVYTKEQATLNDNPPD